MPIAPSVVPPSPGSVLQDTLELLEWPRLCAHLASFTSTRPGYRAALATALPADLATSRSWLARSVELAGLVVSVDRQERASDTSERTALVELAEEFGMPTAAIVTIDEVLQHLGDRLTTDDLARVAQYRDRYGATIGP